MNIRYLFLFVFAALVGCEATVGDNSTSTGKIVSSQQELTARIVVSNMPPSEFAVRASALNRIEVISFSALENQEELEALNREQSVAFLIFGDLEVGDKIETEYTYTRSPTSFASKPHDRPFTQVFKYTVSASTSLQPVLIVNETISIYKGEFIYVVRVNGKMIAQRAVTVKNDFGVSP